MKKTLIIIGMLSFILLSLASCVHPQEGEEISDNGTTASAETAGSAIAEEDSYILIPEQLTSDEYVLATSLFNNVYKYHISIPDGNVDIVLKCKYYHDGKLMNEEELTSKIDSSDTENSIFLALQNEGKIIMAIRNTDGSERTNKRLECSSENKTELIEYKSLCENKEIELGRETVLLALRSSAENPNEDSSHEESKYEDMLFVTFCVLY